MNLRCLLLCLLVALYQSRVQAAGTNLIVEIEGYGVSRPVDPGYYSRESTNFLLAAGEWSQPVSDGHDHNLRGRILVYLYGQSPASVCLEIQDAMETNRNPIRIYCDEWRGIRFQLRDANGAPADKLRLIETIIMRPAPPSIWATLPAGGLLRLDPIDNRGYPASRDLEIAGWIIPAGDKHPYFLSATLSPPPANSIPYNSDVWRGTLEFPAVKLSGSMVETASQMLVRLIINLAALSLGAIGFFLILYLLIGRFLRSKRMTPGRRSNRELPPA